MKFLVKFEWPLEPFNSYVREGTAGDVIGSMLAAIKPEAVYFHTPSGHRGGTMIVDIDDTSQMPAIAEPLFLKLEATCEFQPVMSAEDLGRAGLGELGKAWG